MSKFLNRIFLKITKQPSEFEKILLKTNLLNDDYKKVDQKDFIILVQYLQGKHDIHNTKLISINSFFNYTIDSIQLGQYRTKLKFLYIIHKCIKLIGVDFADIFLNLNPNNLRENLSTKNKQQTLKTFNNEYLIKEYIIKDYYDYLMRMALNIEIYLICLVGTNYTSYTEYGI